MRRFTIKIGLAAVIVFAPFVAFAQPSPGSQPTVAAVVSNCGASSYTAGANRAITQDTTGRGCGNTTSTAAPTNTASGGGTPVTAGVASSTALAANTAKVYLLVWNLSPTATVCVNLGAAATISGTTCAAGELPLSPLGWVVWEGSYVPSDQVNVIASAAATPMTVLAK